MKSVRIDAYAILERVRKGKPLVHHLTNWVTIYDCANIVKVMGASPVMAHAREEAAQMSALASSLVLNIGTLTVDLVEAMKLAARSANAKGIPVLLDACGAGATALRDEKCFELLDEVRIDIVKGNASEIARLAGEGVRTKGVDASSVEADKLSLVRRLAQERGCIVVMTGKEDIVGNAKKAFIIENGTPMMSAVVGTGCMSSSVVGAFAAVEPDLGLAATAGLVCFEVSAELSARRMKGPAVFKEGIFDSLYGLDRITVEKMQKVKVIRYK